MKKMCYNLLIISLLSISTTFAQEGHIHYQSSSLNSGWYPKEGNKILLPVGDYNLNQLVEYDLSDDSHKILNDSAQAYGYATMKADTGVAYGSSPYTYAYYTHDNWTTYHQTTSTDGIGIMQIIKTSTGFLGIRKGTSSNRIVLVHSVSGVTWTVVSPNIIIGSISYHYLNEVNGKVFLISHVANGVEFRVSYDGGQTFTTKTMTGPPNNSALKNLIAFDSLNMLADMSNYVLNYSTDGGQSWTTSPYNTPISKRFLYATGLDSIFYSKDSGIDSIFLSTDLGQTFSFYSQNLPKGYIYGSRLKNQGDYIIASCSKGQYYAKDLNSPWKPFYQKILGASTLDFKGNTGIVAGKNGVAVTFNGGHYFNVMDEVFSEPIYASKVMSDTVMFLADQKSNVFKTSDGGVSWTHCSGSGSTYDLGGRDFYATSTGDTMILTRGGNTHLKSKDRGLTWSNLFGGFGIGGDYDASMTPGGKAYYLFGNSIEEVNPGNGDRTPINTLVGSAGTVYGYGIEMFDNNTGFCWGRDSATGHYSLYKTLDAWANYMDLGEIPGFIYTYSVASIKPKFHFVTEDTIYTFQEDIFQNNTPLFFSFDGGTTWAHDTLKSCRYIPSSGVLEDIHFFDGKTFIAKLGGVIYLNKITGSGGEDPIKIEQIPLEKKLKLYPNPTSNILNIEFDGRINLISIFDMSGKEILSKSIKGASSIDVSNLISGIYLIRIFDNKQSLSQLFIKQ